MQNYNAKEACNWIGYTYLYIHMSRNHLYGIAPDVLMRGITLEERRTGLVASQCSNLSYSYFITLIKQMLVLFGLFAYEASKWTPNMTLTLRLKMN